MGQYLYFIHSRPFISGSKTLEKLPKIVKIEKSKCPSGFHYVDRNEAEGPFETIFELKKKSFILAGYKKQKDRQRILKLNNIKEIKEFVFTDLEESFSIDFLNAFVHITVGKISKRQVKGVHFYNPKSTRILRVIYIDPETNCYLARIKKLNENTGEWIEKEFDSSFFPDNWNLNKLFQELKFSYQNRKKIEGKVYHSETTEGVKVEFIISENEKIITCYPIIEKN